jgi:K+-transporting ATPase A subunit
MEGKETAFGVPGSALFGAALVLVFLTFLPALSLGPLAEGLH